MNIGNRKRSVVLCAAASAGLAAYASVRTYAAPVAYWRFETGPAGANVAHNTADGVFDGQIPDVTGNGNSLSAWSNGGGPGYAYRSDVPFATVPGTGSLNTLSVQNTGGVPGMFTTS